MRRFASRNQHSQPREVGLVKGYQVGRRQRDDRDPLFPHESHQRVSVANDLLADQHQRAAGEQRHEYLGQRSIERARGNLSTGRCCRSQIRVSAPESCSQSAVFDHHSFGPPVDPEVDDMARFRAWPRANGLSERSDPHDAISRAQPDESPRHVRSWRHRSDDATTAVFNHEGDALVRKRRTDRNVRPSSLQDAEESNNPLFAAFCQNADTVLAANRHSLAQKMGESVRSFVQFEIRELSRPKDERRVVRASLHLGFPEIHERLVGRMGPARTFSHPGELAPFCVRQRVEASNCHPVIPENLFEECLKMALQPAHLRCRIDAAVVVERNPQEIADELICRNRSSIARKTGPISPEAEVLAGASSRQCLSRIVLKKPDDPATAAATETLPESQPEQGGRAPPRSTELALRPEGWRRFGQTAF